MLLDPVSQLELANVTHRARIRTAAQQRVATGTGDACRSRRSTLRTAWARVRHP
jgi:hypothetical protein